MAAWRWGVLLILHSHPLISFIGAELEIEAPTHHAVRLGAEARIPCSFQVDKPPVILQYLRVLWDFQGREIQRYLDSKQLVNKSDPRWFFKEENGREGDASLYINNTGLSDAGTYSCMVIYTPDQRVKEINVNVYAPPTIKTLQALKTDDLTTTVLCEVVGFYPKDIGVTLLSDGNALNGSVLTPLTTNSDGSFNINITKTFQEGEEPGTLSCEVSHEFLDYLVGPLKQELNLLYKEKDGFAVAAAFGVVAAVILLAVVALAVWYRKYRAPKRFVVSDIHGPRTWTAGEKATLYCTASDCTQDASAKWIVTHKDGNRLELTEVPSEEAEDAIPLMSREYLVTSEKKAKRGEKGVYDFISSLDFIPSVSRHMGSTVECVVTCAGKTEERTFTCESIYTKPQFNDPINLTVCDKGDVQLGLTLRSFYPKSIDVVWSCDREGSQDTNPQDKITNNFDDTFNLESKRKVSGDLFKDPAFKVSVTWNHESMATPETREISVRDLHWRPEIEDISVQKSPVSRDVELCCKICRVFPDVLAVKWFEKRKGGVEVPVTDAEGYTSPEPVKERLPDHTFSYTSLLVFDKSLISEREAEFICRVEHPSLQKPIQASTGPLQLTDLTFLINSIQGPPIWYVGKKVTLYCAASYCAEDVSVTWLVTEADESVHVVSEVRAGERNDPGHLQSGVYVVSERRDPSDKDGLRDVATSLSFTPSISRHKKASLTCRMVCDGRSKEKRFHPKKVYAKPKAAGPVGLRLCDTGEVICSVDIQGFYPRDIEINWGENLDSVESLNHNGSTYDLRSECKIAADLFKNPDFKVKVSWKHESANEWETKQVSVRDEDFPWRPQIGDIPILNLFNNRSATLTCGISHFFPADLRVSWLKEEKDGRFPLTHGEKYSISDVTPGKAADHTYTCSPCLKFTPSVKTEQGVAFVCKVEHPSLEKPVYKSTGALQVKGFPDVKNILSSGDGAALDVEGFYPKEIAISWKLADGSSGSGSRTVPSSNELQENEDGTFRVTSTCDLQMMDLSAGGQTLTAIVEHETLEGPVCKTISLARKETEAVAVTPLVELQNVITASEPPKENSAVESRPSNQQTEDYMRFIVSAIQGPATWTCGERVCLYCAASYCTEDVEVSWVIEEDDGETPAGQSVRRECMSSTERTEKSDREGLINVTSSLTLIPSVQKHAAAAIKCRFICDNKTKKRTFRPTSIHAKPSVTKPVNVRLGNSGDVTYSLRLKNFYPKDIKIWWTCGVGESREDMKSQEEFSENPDFTFSVQSELTIPGDRFKNREFRVCVSWHHQSMERSESMEMSARDAEFPWRPEIEEIPVSRIVLLENVTFQYNISKYFPDILTVNWFKKEKGEEVLVPLTKHDKYQIPALSPRQQPDGTYSCTARLIYTPSLISEQGVEFICRVEHPSLIGPIERRTGPLQVTAKPSVTKPVNVRLGNSGDVTYSLRLKNFYPKDIKIWWTCGVGASREDMKSQEEFSENPDFTFSVQSELTIPGDRFKNREFRVCVSWHHQSMERSESMEMSARDAEFPWRPEIEEIPVSRIVLLENVTFKYNISKYFPDILTVNWFKKEKGEEVLVPLTKHDKYQISALSPRQQPDGTYSCTARLIYTPSLISEQGVEFICRVEHPSLIGPIERRTGPLQVIAIPKVQPLKVVVNDLGEIRLLLEMQSFYPKDIQIEWSVQAGNSDHTLESREEFKDNSDLTYGLLSQCKVPGDFFRDPGVRVSVKWRRNSSHDSNIHHVSWGYPDFPWRPQIGDVVVPNLLVGQEVELSCRISHCLPSTIAVQWFLKPGDQNNLFQVTEGPTYKIPGMKIERESESSFSCTAFLIVTPSSDTTNGHVYICSVHHPGLHEPIQRETGLLRLMQPEARNEVAEIDAGLQKPIEMATRSLRLMQPEARNEVVGIDADMECDSETHHSFHSPRETSSEYRNSELQKAERVWAKLPKRKRSDGYLADSEIFTKQRKRDCEEDPPSRDDDDDSMVCAPSPPSPGTGGEEVGMDTT